MADEIKGAAQSSGAPTYVQQEANATPKVTDPTNVHEALTASTEPNATSIGNLDAKNRRMYKHIPAEMRRDYLEDEAEQARVDANQDAVIEDHVKRLAAAPNTYGHITGVYDNIRHINSSKFVYDSVLKISSGKIYIDTAGANELGVVMPGDGLAMGLVDNNPSKPTGRLNVKPATTSTIGGVKVGDNIAVTNDGTISTDVNKAYVDKLISEIPKTAIYFIQRNPLDFTINGNSYNGISSSMGVISDNNNNIMSGYIEIEGVSGNYSAGDSITIGISGFHFFGPYTTFTTDSAYITGLYYNSSDGGNTLIGSITKDTTNIPDFSIFVNTLSNRFIAKDGLAGFVKPSTSITAASDGTIKINPSIFSDGLTATDAQVSADLGFIGEHLAGDALYYDSTNGLMLKCGTGLHIGNDAVSVDADTLPLATASTRGTVKVGSGLSIAEDGTLSAASAGCDVSYSGFHTSNSTFTSISFNYAFYNRSGDTIPLECKGTVINKTAFTTGTKMQFGVNYSAAKFDNNPVGVFETIMATKKWFGVLVSTSSSTAPKHTVIDSDNIVVTYATSSGFSRAEFEVTVPFDVAANSTIYFYMM